MIEFKGKRIQRKYLLRAAEKARANQLGLFDPELLRFVSGAILRGRVSGPEERARIVESLAYDGSGSWARN